MVTFERKYSPSVDYILETILETQTQIKRENTFRWQIPLKSIERQIIQRNFVLQCSEFFPDNL